MSKDGCLIFYYYFHWLWTDVWPCEMFFNVPDILDLMSETAWTCWSESDRKGGEMVHFPTGIL